MDRKPFMCTAYKCCGDNNDVAGPAFARSDKLTSHIKNMHSSETLFGCPFSGPCSSEHMTLQALEHHFHVVHRTAAGENAKQVRAMVNASKQ